MSDKTLTDAERQVSRRLSRGFAWPTVLLLVAQDRHLIHHLYPSIPRAPMLTHLGSCVRLIF